MQRESDIFKCCDVKSKLTLHFVNELCEFWYELCNSTCKGDQSRLHCFFLTLFSDTFLFDCYDW